MHPEFQELYKTIVKEPEDDGLRLIASDWCEDAGEYDRAEFIRLQLEEAKTGILSARTIELFSKHWKAWFTFSKPLYRFVRLCMNGYIHKAEYIASAYITAGDVSRGFVSEINCTQAEWLKSGKDVVKDLPITYVDLRDKMPNRIGESWYYLRELSPSIEYTRKAGDIDGKLLRFMSKRPLDSNKEAQKVLSAACLEFARRGRVESL